MNAKVLKHLLQIVAVVAPFGVTCAGAAGPAPDFIRDIQPILSENCYQCHGPDAGTREADLRLDDIDTAIESGAIVPGEAGASMVVMRVNASNERKLMPPPRSKKSLSDRQKQQLADWIAAGAKHEAHWGFKPVVKPPIPAPGEPGIVLSPIDAFIQARLRAEGLAPSPEADRETLLRRVTFDLTGLPPSIEEMDAYLADTAPGAFERVVDRLLASPRHGERMALAWLDAARYADTFGYQADRETHLWPWRDWVIRAFNEGMPYDRFITEQLAGDLLPDPTQDQRLATAFNRLHRQTNEGGSVEEEFRIEYVSDRTETLGTAILGLTLECARCHDHKFDPTTQREYFQLSAFFNSIDESGLYSHFTETAPTPAMMLFKPGQREELARLKQVIADRASACDAVREQGVLRFMKWLRSPDRGVTTRKPVIHLPLDDPPAEGKLRNEADPGNPASISGPYVSEPGHTGEAGVFDGDNSVAIGKGANFERSDPFTLAMWLKAPAFEPRMVVCHRSEAASDAASRGYEVLLEDGHVVFGLTHFWPGNALRIRSTEALPAGAWVHVAVTYDGSSRASGARIHIDGRLAPCEVIRDGLYRTIRYGDGGTPALRLAARFRDNGFKGGRIDDFRVYDAELTPTEVRALATGVPIEQVIADTLRQGDEGMGVVRAHWAATTDEAFAKAREELRAARAEEVRFSESIPQIMVMEEMAAPRPAHILGRGSYMSKLEEVGRGTPRFLPPFPADLPRNRLGLARWLFLPEHPLTSRVAVNRLWAQFFGRGLVASAEDFGVQGTPPTHPELLDYLAARYIELGWNTKALMREMVLSVAYRQASHGDAAILARDPENTLLARGPSHRLMAEEIRDAALASAGLLVPEIGGPSAKPYQPEGIWKDVSGTDYPQDKGGGLYRRSMYTFVKRTAPPPTMLLFDSVSRETCVVRRERTETPLQALALMNDPQFVEAARVTAERVMTAAHGEAEDTVETLFRLLTSRRPTSTQHEILIAAHREQRDFFASRPEEAKGYVTVGERPPDANLDVTELAAMTAVAQLVMNFDAFQMKP